MPAVIFDTADHVATITLNRPEKLNAFTSEMLLELDSAIDECDRQDDVRAVILTGAGRGFAAAVMWGAWALVRTIGHTSPNNALAVKYSVFPSALRFAKPIIAAVNGPAAGGGMDLALACDFRTASRSARFAETYGKDWIIARWRRCLFPAKDRW